MRIGCGAGFAGDRTEPAVDLAERGRLDVLVLECLAERTIADAQLRRLADPAAGFDPMLLRRLRPLLPRLGRHGTRLVTNAGAANPGSAGEAVRDLAAELGHPAGVAVVTGDDVLGVLDRSAPAWEDGRPLDAHGEIVSANAYLGADALRDAMDTAAPVIVTGRVADPSLFAGPLAHAYGWDPADWDRIAAGSVVGHLLECAGQVTGGYFADPPAKTVPGLARLGFPLAEVAPDGSAVITKLPGTGGRVDRATVAEQITYELGDPSAYLTPDATVDFTGVTLRDLGGDRVAVRGARGRPRPRELKVSVGYRAGFRGEGEISYAGRNAVARARLAGEIVRERLSSLLPGVRVDVIGVDSLHGPRPGDGPEPYECRLRVAGLAADRAAADAVGEEVVALYTNGPAGGAGARARTDEVIGVLSTTVPRDAVTVHTTLLGARDDRTAV